MSSRSGDILPGKSDIIAGIRFKMNFDKSCAGMRLTMMNDIFGIEDFVQPFQGRGSAGSPTQSVTLG